MSSYHEKLFIVETRFHQLNKLRNLIIELNLIEDFEEMLNEIKNILLHSKLELIKNKDYVYVKFTPLSYNYEKEVTYDIVDKMVFVLFQTIIKECDISLYYDQEAITIINSTVVEEKVYLPSFERYLKYSISNVNFTKWNKKRIALFMPDIIFNFIKKDEMENELKDICGICMENHKKKEIVSMKCSHEFGQVCFQSWMNICKNNSKCLTCPLCRDKVTQVTYYKESLLSTPEIIVSVPHPIQKRFPIR